MWLLAFGAFTPDIILVTYRFPPQRDVDYAEAFAGFNWIIVSSTPAVWIATGILISLSCCALAFRRH